MAAFALALGANNFQVGILAALPFVTQVLQLPATLAVERFRRRKAIGIHALCAANLMWIPIGAVPFFGHAEPEGQVLTGDHRVVGDEV